MERQTDTRTMPLSEPSLPLRGQEAGRRAITWRSVLLGTAMVCLVCGITPYNDYVVYNTFMVGSYFPLAMVVSFFILIVLVNGPLHRLAPARALGSGELAVVLAMMLVGCGIPSQGLLRYFLPQLVAPFHFGATDAPFWKAFEALGLPHWLFAVGDGSGRDLTHSPVVRYFYQRVPEDGSIPWRPWVTPLLGWGVFLAGWAACLIGLAAILRRQWGDNERLPFPLAQLELALIQPPHPGRALNETFRSRALWIGLAAVFCIQSLAALRQYYPKHIPEIPLTYDLTRVFSEEPWSFLSWLVKRNTIYFTFIGITFFLQSRVGISLWGIFLLTQLVQMGTASYRLDVPAAAWQDEHLGASLAFVAGVIWVGRRQWGLVLRHLLAGRSSREKQAGAESFRTSAMAVLCGVAVMVGWMRFVGTSWAVALGTVAFILLAHVVVARVVAETGFPFFRFMGAGSQIYGHLPAGAVAPHDLFVSEMALATGPLATRESGLVFAMHGLQVAEGVTPPVRAGGRGGLLALMAWSWVLGLAVAAGSSLYCYYTYATPITQQVQDVINPWGSVHAPQQRLVNPLKQSAAHAVATPQNYSSALHVAIGAAVTGLLQVGALRYAAWPLLPVGYVVCFTWYMQMAWFSIFLGWLCKVLVVRFGGIRFYQKAKPFFIGIIFGEALAAGFWLIVNLLLAWSGHEYKVVNFLPM